MTLGWQGFQFDHPDDWALSRVTGNRSRGFLVLTSPGSASLQVRWEPSGDPAIAARRYLDSLKKDSPGEISVSDTAVTWKRPGQGRGYAGRLKDGRLLIVEASGGDQLLPIVRRFRESLREGGLWSVYGLAVTLPEAFDLAKSEFLSGRTKLSFRARGAELTAERFGLAAQLLKGGSIEDFAEGFPNVHADINGPYNHSGSLIRGHDRTLIHSEPDLNQLSVLSGHARRLELLPEWEWFDRIGKKPQS